MANITGTGTVWNLPNYAGQLYTSTPTETPFLNLIAANAVMTDNFEFPTGAEYSHEAAAQPSITEVGSLTAPGAIGYVRTQSKNVTQIFQEKVSVSYARLANCGRLSGVSSSFSREAVPDELEFQTTRALEKIARDIEYTFINGTYQLSDAANVANRTRGMLSACQTSVNAEGAALTKSLLNDAFRQAFDAGATFTNMVIFCGADVKQAITTAYADQMGFNISTNTGGANIMQIETDFGPVSIVISRYMPEGTLLGADVSCIRPVEQEVPGKGNFFREQLSKTGAAEEYQIFGQIGLDHGPEWKHFKITDIGAAE